MLGISAQEHAGFRVLEMLVVEKPCRSCAAPRFIVELAVDDGRRFERKQLHRPYLHEIENELAPGSHASGVDPRDAFVIGLHWRGGDVILVAVIAEDAGRRRAGAGSCWPRKSQPGVALAVPTVARSAEVQPKMPDQGPTFAALEYVPLIPLRRRRDEGHGSLEVVGTGAAAAALRCD